MAFSNGVKDFPSGVSEYSTRGGASAKISRSIMNILFERFLLHVIRKMNNKLSYNRYYTAMYHSKAPCRPCVIGGYGAFIVDHISTVPFITCRKIPIFCLY